MKRFTTELHGGMLSLRTARSFTELLLEIFVLSSGLSVSLKTNFLKLSHTKIFEV